MLQLKKIIVLLMIVFGFQISSAQVNILNAKVANEIGVKTEAQIQADNDKPLPYGYVDDRDILWSVEVWEVIDLNERANFPLLFPTDTLEVDAYRRSLYDVLLKNIKNGKIKDLYVDSFLHKLKPLNLSRPLFLKLIPWTKVTTCSTPVKPSPMNISLVET